MNTEASKERLPSELFVALSKSMNSDKPNKELMSKTPEFDD
jgi:hypothetical protein